MARADMIADALAEFDEQHPGQQPEAMLVHPKNYELASELAGLPVQQNSGCFLCEVWLMVPQIIKNPVNSVIQLSF
jgi:hypothetical protein